MKVLPLLLAGLQAWMAAAAKDPKIENVEEMQDSTENPRSSPNPQKLDVDVSVNFPQSEIFGIKLVNGLATQAVMSFRNNEPEPVYVMFAGGSLWTPPPPAGPDPSVVLRNLTTVRYGAEIPAGETKSLAYNFATEMHPQELSLHIIAILTDAQQNGYYTFEAFNQTVSIVEAPISLFDPQIIFLYLILAGVFGGTCYFIYNTWITTLFPQTKRGGKGGERAKRSSQGSKKVDPADQVAVIGADGPAVTSGAQAFDQDWIPAHHLQRPEAKRTGSGRPKSAKK